MKDIMKCCQHTFSEDVEFKEVVVIGNGPSGMVTSYMLAGNVPYLKEIPDDLPIDEMLKARLSNLPAGQSLYETDLMELAEGLEGRSQNPIPLLMDNLLRPCADLGIQADSLIEWKHDIDKQIDHIVLGKGPAGGSWPTFPPSVLTLSPGAWLALPPHTALGAGRLSARAVAHYCRRYVHACKLQRYFRSGVIVNSVRLLPRPAGPPCDPACPLNAKYCVSGYEKSSGAAFTYVCARVVVASGACDKPNSLEPRVASHALHSLAALQRAMTHLKTKDGPPSILIVGSGVSAADAVRLARGSGTARALHVHREPADALARLDPAAYPDYCQVYKMMCDGTSGNYPLYTSYPEHVIVDVSDLDNGRLKRVTLLNLATNDTTEVTVSLISVLIGSKPDLFFLQTNYNLNWIDLKCIKCIEETKHASKRKIEDDNQRQCFLKNHWHYLKSVLGQSIQSCKSRYLNYTEINGNNDSKCKVPDCDNRKDKCTCLGKLENGVEKNDCEIIPYSDRLENKIKCTCKNNPYSSGLGFGIDPKKPVDGRSNPIAIDKTTHELLNAPKGIYALGPLTADNFVRFIPGGALAIVTNIHRTRKNCKTE